MSKTYVPYHVHTELSLLDSCTSYKLYVDRCVELGIPAICFSEHGYNMLDWVEKKQYCEYKGVKYLHGCEGYLTRTHSEKVRDNFHVILIAKNFAGFQELNSLAELSSRDDHKYYNDRISFDEYFALSDNVIKISACLASPLSRIDESDPVYKKLIKSYDFLEVQPHVKSSDQKMYNQKLIRLSKEYGVPLIAGTDTHSVNSYKAECRGILLKAKRKAYGDEDEFDLTFKSREELLDMFQQQGVLPVEAYTEAVDNTTRLLDMVEDFELDKKFKYPELPGYDADGLRRRAYDMYREKVAAGIVPDSKAYEDRIEEELRVLGKLGMESYILVMSDMMTWRWENNIPTVPCRGSAGGSLISYLTNITDVNPMVWGTMFSRFANESRLEIGDIDVDTNETDRPKVFEYLINRFGTDKTAFVLTTTTCADKGTIDEICRALEVPLTQADKIKNEYEANPEAARKRYKDVFYYFDGLSGTVIAKGTHPAAIVISPVTLPDNYGVFHDSEGKLVLSINMDEIHDVSLVKYDILGLKNLGIVRDCCKLAGIPYPRTHDFDWCDTAVWDAIVKDNTGIFQFESDFGGSMLKKFKPASMADLAILTAVLRPGSSSYRDEILQRIPAKNPSELIDSLLKDSYGYLVFQEDTIRFLQDTCGFSGSEADNIRRAIGRKDEERMHTAMPQILDGYCRCSGKDRKVAEEEARAFMQIIEDSVRYQFNLSHAIGYSMLGYMLGWLRYYYPLEFCTAFLQNSKTEADIAAGTAMAKRLGVEIRSIKFRRSRSVYYMNKEENRIYKGIGSIKYLSAQAADDLARLGENGYLSFMVLLKDILVHTCVDTRQLEILIRLDYFSEFGNAKMLLRMVDVFNSFKASSGRNFKKKIAKDKLTNQVLYDIIETNSIGTNAKGQELSSFTFTDVVKILRECETYIKSLGIEDFDAKSKIADQREYLGYISATGREEDRRTLVVNEIYPVKRKSDGKLFGYNVRTTSVGSGVDGVWTVFCKRYNQDPLKTGNIIRMLSYKRDGVYFTLEDYSILA